MWVGCCLAPSPVPWCVACYARFPGLRHPLTVVAWHLSVCLGCGWWCASLACVVAPRGAPHLVRSAFSSPWCLPLPGAFAPRFTGRLRGARRGRPRPRLMVPAAGPCRGRGAGLATCCTRPGYCNGVVPGWSLRDRSWAPCAAVVWRVRIHSLTRPVSCTVCVSTGDSASAPGSFLCGNQNHLFWVGGRDALAGCVSACACSSWPGRAGRPPRRVLVRLTFPLAVLSFGFAGPPPGWGCPFLVLLFAFVLFLFFFSLFA